LTIHGKSFILSLLFLQQALIAGLKRMMHDCVPDKITKTTGVTQARKE
jgi:hypothetical protein